MKQELIEKSNIIKSKILANPRLLNVNSFLAEDGLNRFFKREFKFWKDCQFLIEIKSEAYYYELKSRLKEIDLFYPSLKESITILRKKLEINYLNNLTKAEFRIFKFLRENGRYENNLVHLILSNRNITKFSEMLLTQDKVAAIGLIDNLESNLSSFIQLNLNLRSRSQQANNHLWKPKDTQAKEILDRNNVDGYNFSILNNALKHLNYCSCVLLDCNAILYLKKVNLVIALAPKFKTSNFKNQ